MSVSPSVRRIVELMEDRWTIPGTSRTFGLDAVVGLVPGIGDFLGTLIGLIVVVEAVRQRVPWRIVGTMVFNLWIDGVVGSIPVVGDAFDFAFKAHRRNLRLLEKHA